MTGWLASAEREADLLALLPGLAPLLATHRADTASACPGRTADLILARAGQLIAGSGSLDQFGDLDAGEETVVAITEQFLIDVHGIDDALVARLGDHFGPAEQIAIMFQVAYADGFTMFRRIFGVG